MIRARSFSVYEGARRPLWSRFLVVTRYAAREAWGSRRLLVALIAAAVILLVGSVIVYLHHNAEALAVLQIPVDEIVPIDAEFFYRLMSGLGFVFFFVTLFIGPTLLTADLADNALPLYLSRPLSRLGYVAGKLAVIALYGSLVTWVPLLALFALRGSLAGPAWAFENARIAAGVFLGSWLEIALLGIVALAVSATLRSRAAAEGVFVAIFVALPVVGKVVNEILDVEWGAVLHLPFLLAAIWRSLLGMPLAEELSPTAAWVAMAAIVALAAIVLFRKIEAYEEIR